MSNWLWHEPQTLGKHAAQSSGWLSLSWPHISLFSTHSTPGSTILHPPRAYNPVIPALVPDGLSLNHCPNSGAWLNTLLTFIT